METIINNEEYHIPGDWNRLGIWKFHKE